MGKPLKLEKGSTKNSLKVMSWVTVIYGGLSAVSGLIYSMYAGFLVGTLMFVQGLLALKYLNEQEKSTEKEG